MKHGISPHSATIKVLRGYLKWQWDAVKNVQFIALPACEWAPLGNRPRLRGRSESAMSLRHYVHRGQAEKGWKAWPEWALRCRAGADAQGRGDNPEVHVGNSQCHHPPRANALTEGMHSRVQEIKRRVCAETASASTTPSASISAHSTSTPTLRGRIPNAPNLPQPARPDRAARKGTSQPNSSRRRHEAELGAASGTWRS